MVSARGQDGYRALFANDAISERRRACDVHAGDWTVVLTEVATVLQPFPASADTTAISHAARNHAPFANLTPADRRLTLALLSYSDSLRVYTTVTASGNRFGQHRICWARTAGVAALPMWFDAGTVHPPRTAVLLQLGCALSRPPFQLVQLGVATPPATATYRLPSRPPAGHASRRPSGDGRLQRRSRRSPR